MQEDIDKIIAEYCRLYLEINPAKSKFLLCSLGPRTPQLELNSWTIQDTAITRVETLRYLDGWLFGFGIPLRMLSTPGMNDFWILFMGLEINRGDTPNTME